MGAIRLILASAAALVLCSCGVYEREVACQQQAGPKPYGFADMFGVIGTMAAESTRERLEWDAKVAECKLRHAPSQKRETKPTKPPKLGHPNTAQTGLGF